MRILVAEDDPNILQGVAELLEREGWEVLRAKDGKEALLVYQREHPDFLLLDIMMPNKSGYDVCREVRAKDSLVPILFLSAKAEEIDRVVGLELGADDYLGKPFGTRELLARIGAIVRRSHLQSRAKEQGDADNQEFCMGDLSVIPSEYRARRKDRLVDLGPRDLSILRLFYRRRGMVVDREELFKECWGADFPGTTRAVDQHISQLRRKIEENPDDPRLIRTVHGAGYRWEG